MHLCGQEIGPNRRIFIAGPCVIESEAFTLATAERLRAIADRLGVQLIYKSSFDKANRSLGQVLSRPRHRGVWPAHPGEGAGARPAFPS